MSICCNNWVMYFLLISKENLYMIISWAGVNWLEFWELHYVWAFVVVIGWFSFSWDFLSKFFEVVHYFELWKKFAFILSSLFENYVKVVIANHYYFCRGLVAEKKIWKLCRISFNLMILNRKWKRMDYNSFKNPRIV